MSKIILLMIIGISLYGVQAYKGEIEFKQSDNSTFNAQLKGDEWFNWVQTQDGYIVQYNPKSKNYEYMILQNNETLIFSDVKVAQTPSKSPSRSSANKVVNLPANIQKIDEKILGKLWQKAWKKEKALSSDK